MTPTAVSKAIESGVRRGTRLAMDPTVNTFRTIQTKPAPQSSTVQMAWADTAQYMNRAMSMQKASQK